MVERLLRLVRAMEIEEKVLHVGVLLCIFALFLPWIGGQWYGNTQQWSGFGFYTGYIGHTVFLLQLYILAMTASPILGGPIIVRKAVRNSVRLSASVISFVLLLAAFTILLRLTSEVSGAEIRFGIYVALVGSALATLYAFLRYQEQRRNEIRELFHHPDAQQPVKKPASAAFDEDRPPPPPPPPPMPPEDHQLFSRP
ncbi:MAG: hypothetical protein WC840_00725 [Candidatus Peribacteraceae bacterium]